MIWEWHYHIHVAGPSYPLTRYAVFHLTYGERLAKPHNEVFIEDAIQAHAVSQHSKLFFVERLYNISKFGHVKQT